MMVSLHSYLLFIKKQWNLVIFLKMKKVTKLSWLLFGSFMRFQRPMKMKKTKTSMWNMVNPVIVTGLIIRTIDSHQWRLVVPDLLTLQDSETKMHMSSKHWLGALVLVKIQTIHRIWARSIFQMKLKHIIQLTLDLKEFLMGVVLKSIITSQEILLKMYCLEPLVVRVEEVTIIELNTM